MRLRPLLLCAAILISGCAVPWFPDPLEVMRDDNKRKLAGLAVGMTRDKVETVMGNQPAGGSVFDALFGRVQYLGARNPMRDERLRGTDGVEYEVFFYYTDVRQLDDKITDDELTPVVFRDGRIAGIGYDFLGERAPKYRGIR